jgi:hypothetical protein
MEANPQNQKMMRDAQLGPGRVIELARVLKHQALLVQEALDNRAVACKLLCEPRTEVNNHPPPANEGLVISSPLTASTAVTQIHHLNHRQEILHLVLPRHRQEMNPKPRGATTGVQIFPRMKSMHLHSSTRKENGNNKTIR